jgi:hypothetical protein
LINSKQSHPLLDNHSSHKEEIIMYRPREDNAADKHAGKRRLSYPALCEVESIRIPDPDSLLSPCSERGFQPLESTFTGELNFQPDHVEESPSPVPETANQQQRRYESEKHSKSAALQRRESQHSVPGSVTSIAEPALAPKKEKKVFTRNEIEVAPGVYMPLHGSEETLESMRDDAMKFSPCPICTLDIL